MPYADLQRALLVSSGSADSGNGDVNLRQIRPFCFTPSLVTGSFALAIDQASQPNGSLLWRRLSRQRPLFRIGFWCDLFDRSRESVPAGFPEPYLYDRLFSGSEIAVGCETASAKEEVGESASFIKCMVAQSVRDLKIYAPNNCISLVLPPRARSSFRISANLSSLILARCAPRFVLGEGSSCSRL
jgi:hypothetical protein